MRSSPPLPKLRSLFHAAVLCAALPGAACTAHNAPENIADAGVELQVPAAEAYTMGPGDALKIAVWRHDDLTMDVIVAPDGAITYPLVGRLQIAGKTYEQVTSTLQEAISKYYVDAQVSVNITSVTNQKVLVLGEVANPMVLQITNDLSIMEALVRTGGINPDAHTSNVLLVRGGLDKPKLYTVDVDAIFRTGDMSQMVYLQRGDIVVVPPKTITNVQRFFQRVSSILGPAVSASTIYRNVVYGQSVGN